MSLSLPAGRTGQSLALGLPILTIAVLWLGVAMPLIEWHGDRTASLIRLSALADRMEVLAAAVPALREQAEASGGTGEPALLDGDSDSTASASLQEGLQAMSLQPGLQRKRVE